MLVRDTFVYSLFWRRANGFVLLMGASSGFSHLGKLMPLLIVKFFPN
jgi:hypothetical protein